jgi:hypothetical protein
MHSPTTLPAAPACRHREPHLVGRPPPVDRLQQQLEIEAKLHLHHDQLRRLAILRGDDIASADFAFDAEARRFEEALHRRIEGGLGHAAQPATADRAAATARPACPPRARQARASRIAGTLRKTALTRMDAPVRMQRCVLIGRGGWRPVRRLSRG